MESTSKKPSTSCAPLVVKSGVMCSLCSRQFASMQLLNRHKLRIHKIVTISRESRIICPLCEERHKLKTHLLLRKHLKEKHEVNTELLTLQFSSIQEYESWKKEGNIDAGYAMHRTKLWNDHKEVNYICNRSDYKGYQANYQKRREKLGGTIRIQGMCPSKLTCKFYDNGSVSVAFWKTHVGHDRELRSLHLSKAEKDILVDKMKSGMSTGKILEDARKLKGPDLRRINLITRDDIIYLTRKCNLNKKSICNGMVSDPLEVEELNADDSRNGYKKKLNADDYRNGYKKSICNEMVADPLVVEECNADDCRNGYKMSYLCEVAKALGENVEIEVHDEEIAPSIEEKPTQQIVKSEDNNAREAKWTNFENWVAGLNDQLFSSFMDNIQGAIRKANQARHRLSKQNIETYMRLRSI